MIHVMSYMTQSSYEAEQDDPSARDMTLADMASPQVARLTSEASEAWIRLCKQDVEEELTELELDTDRTGDVEHDALEAWRKTRVFSGAHWCYGELRASGAIYPTDDGQFLVWGIGERLPTLKLAEEECFYKQVLPTLTLPAPPPLTFEWKTDGWVTPEHGRVHQVYQCYWGGQLMAVMVIQQLEDDPAEEPLTCRHCGEDLPKGITPPGQPDCPACGRDN